MTSNAEPLLAEKIDVVLVMLNSTALKSTIKILNFDRVNLVAIVANGYAKKIFVVGANKIPVTTFATIHSTIRKYKKIFWLINGANVNSLRKIKIVLTADGVPEDNIINFGTPTVSSTTWLANLRHIDEHGAEFFVTGNEYTQIGVNLNLIPTVTQGGVNLSDVNQTLRQSYLTAKHVFAHVAPGTIKFVIIGLMPHSLRYDTTKNFLYSPQSLQYALLFDEPTAREEFLMSLLKGNLKKFFANITLEQADVNFDAVRTSQRGELSAKSIADCKDTAKFFMPDDTDDNSQIVKDYVVLEDYIELCLANGAKPIGVFLPFAPAVRKNFDQKLLTTFREMIHQPEENHDFICMDMFDLNIGYDCFSDMMYLNERGQTYVNSLISLQLWKMNFLPTDGFCNMTYEYFNRLARRAPKEDYNELFERVLEISVQRIRRKKKIKLGFVLYDASMWCGDDLYNYFARDDRFEVIVFLCIRVDKVVTADNEVLFKRNLSHGVEQLTSHGLNVIVLNDANATIPEQDLFIFLTPYLNWLPYAFRLPNIKPTTLIAHIPYAFDTATREIMCREPLFIVLWKLFAPSIITLKMYEQYCTVGIARGVYGGYPKLDVFFKRDMQFKFDWKTARPDAKKIIYAPHWSINDGVNFATFQWNYKFIYEFAKAHPEISWTVKPHPNLMYSSVKSGLFASIDDFKKYLQDWDALPNAQVYTGGYYQAIFATSDGMIHDSGSFSVEYQYVDKPMIYLTNNTERRDDLGQKILAVSYCVDGQDLEGIAATIQRVFIDGNDYKAAERRKLFDEHLNYPKINGMLASEFIYYSIADDLKEVSE